MFLREPRVPGGGRTARPYCSSRASIPEHWDDDANKKAAAEHKDRKYNVRTYEHFPVRFWNEWLDERQPTLMVQALDQESAKDILSATKFAHEPGFGRLGHRRRCDARAAMEPGRAMKSFSLPPRSVGMQCLRTWVTTYIAWRPTVQASRASSPRSRATTTMGSSAPTASLCISNSPNRMRKFTTFNIYTR